MTLPKLSHQNCQNTHTQKSVNQSQITNNPCLSGPGFVTIVPALHWTAIILKFNLMKCVCFSLTFVFQLPLMMSHLIQNFFTVFLQQKPTPLMAPSPTPPPHILYNPTQHMLSYAGFCPSGQTLPTYPNYTIPMQVNNGMLH